MADKKISALTSLTQGDVAASTDVLPIVDTSATETKKITASALVGAGMTAGVTNVDINSGSIDGTTIGANSAAAGTFTNLTASGTVSFSGATVSNGGAVTTIDINGGTIDATSIGASSASTGAFTTLSASSTVSGTGFSTYLASPPAIGGTTAAAGSFTTLTTSSTVTLNGGTANGVLYLNGSKVATSGSALTFDGTRLLVGPTTQRGGFGVQLANTNGFSVQDVAATATAAYFAAGGSVGLAAGDFAVINGSSGHIYGVAGSEAMRLTSSTLYTASGINVGIGTSSPSAKLHVKDATGTAVTLLNLESGYSNPSGNKSILWTDATNALGRISVSYTASTGSTMSFGSLYNGGYQTSDLMVLTNTGNLGIGTSSPAASNLSGSATVVNVKGNSANKIGTFIAQSFGTTNATNIEMFASDGANEAGLLIKGASTAMTFYTGSVPDKRMTLDSSGNLGLGVTPTNNTLGKSIQNGQASAWVSETGSNRFWLASNWKYDGSDKYLNNGFATLYSQQSGQHQWLTSASGTINTAISFTQAMTLDASGNLLLGTTTATVAGTDYKGITIRDTDGSSIWMGGGASGTANEFYVSCAPSSTSLINFSNTPLVLGTNNTERARITSAGEFLVGATAISSYFDGKLNVAGSTFVKTTTNNSFLWATNTTGDNAFLFFGTEGTFTERGLIDYNRAGGLVRYNTTSDYRAKDILGPVQNSGAIIDSLKVYEGVMKGATQSRPMLIAHEAQEYAPYAVSGVKDEVKEDGTPKYQQMDVSALVPLLLAEIQSLRARVAQLESK